MAQFNAQTLNKLVKELPPMPEEGWRCADCGTEILVGNLVGKKKKDRKVVCSKCVKEYKQ